MKSTAAPEPDEEFPKAQHANCVSHTVGDLKEYTIAAMVRFWVRDNGGGLSPVHQARLFTPFTRLHTERADGQGLGLSIVQQIIERLGGSVGVESAPGQGAAFYFTLPAA